MRTETNARISDHRRAGRAAVVYSGVREPENAPPPLSAEERARYSRHLILPGVGTDGQQRLKQSRILIVGAGGLGSPVAMYLAAAGVGHLGVVDGDLVDLSNLQRQILHGTGDIGRRKTDSAAERLLEINPNVEVTPISETLTASNAIEILEGYDIVVDGTDNFPTRYLISDACVLLRKPNVHGSIIRFQGQASVFSHGDGPCYRCLFREPPAPGTVPNCAEGGVFGVIPGIVGSIQATEALKLALGLPDVLSGRLLLIDAMRMQFRSIRIVRDPDCPACGTHELTELIDYDAFCGVTPAAPGPFGTTTVREIMPRELAERMRRGDDFVLLDVREPSEWALARIDGARLVPLGSLEEQVSSLDRSRDLVVHCHHGIRSAAAIRYLQAQGFDRLWNLAGGIARWSSDVDDSIPQY